jgi:hypothetical protein
MEMKMPAPDGWKVGDRVTVEVVEPEPLPVRGEAQSVTRFARVLTRGEIERHPDSTRPK